MEVGWGLVYVGSRGYGTLEGGTRGKVVVVVVVIRGGGSEGLGPSLIEIPSSIGTD